MNEIFVAITMDCERDRTYTHPNASGPLDFAASERYVRAYVELAGAYGWPVSFFLHPEVAEGQAELFLELESQGACLGLHLHPWKFGDRKYQAHLGGLSEDAQRAVISEAIAVWQRAIGRRPLYFRPGTFSANDATFRVLVDLGFRGGSVSAPGRVYREINSIWSGAEQDPHRANGIFRFIRGTLDFANMPLTHDYSSLERLNGRLFHRDLRPDYHDVDYATIAENIAQQIVERDPAVPVINVVTHNDNDYADPDDRVRRNYDVVLAQIAAACERHGLRPTGTTVDRVCEMVLGVEAVEDEFVAT